MSGGHWDYSHYCIQDNLKQVADDEEVRRRFPELSLRIDKLAMELSKIIVALDRDISGDTRIIDDGEFERKALGALKE